MSPVRLNTRERHSTGLWNVARSRKCGRIVGMLYSETPEVPTSPQLMEQECSNDDHQRQRQPIQSEPIKIVERNAVVWPEEHSDQEPDAEVHSGSNQGANS